MIKKINLLDCTLRDGGYYNYWNFSSKLVKNYLNCISKSKIKYVELGFRFANPKSFYGPFSTTTENFLNSLCLPKSVSYGVMINAKDFFFKLELLEKKFLKSTSSKISFVRVAVNFDDYQKCEEICKIIKDKGYLVGLNLMQAHDKKNEKYIEVGSEIKNWKKIDILYFADTLGCMDADNIITISNKLSASWGGPLGIHAHNNKGIALSNTMVAVNNGITWCDATISGMGRGAGNVQTEHLAVEISERNLARISAKHLIGAIKDFSILKKRHNWGPNIFYHFAALKRIHPTYVQNILSDERYDKSDLIKSLQSLGKFRSSSYNSELAAEVFYNNKKIIKGTWNAKNKFLDKEIILVGPGPSIKKYKKKIISYIIRNKKRVLFLNINPFLNNNLGYATIACNNSRVAIESYDYKNIRHNIILPKKKLKNVINFKNKKILNYEMNVRGDGFEIFNNYCNIKWPLAIAYALSILTIANVKDIKLIGFDGYKNDKEKNLEMNEVFKKYQSVEKSKNITSLTPTKYNLKKKILFK
jgi:4-hydroxy 2-oxovalerate aldolase